LSKRKGRGSVCLADGIVVFVYVCRQLEVVKAAARPPHSKRGEVVALAGRFPFAEI